MSFLLLAANVADDDCATTCCGEDDCESNTADFENADGTTEPTALAYTIPEPAWTFADGRLKSNDDAAEATWWVPLTGGDGPLIYKAQANVYGTLAELGPFSGGLFLRGNSAGWSVRAGYEGEDFILEWTDTVAGVIRTVTISLAQPRGTLLKLWVVPRCETLAAIILHFEDGKTVTRRVRMNAMPTYELDEVTIAPIRAGLWRGATEDTGVADPCCPGFNRKETYTIDDSFVTDEGTYTVFGVLTWIEDDSRWFGSLHWQGCGESYFEDTWIVCDGGTYKLFGTIAATLVNCNAGRLEFANVALPLLCPNLEVPLETWVFLGSGGGAGTPREFDNLKMSACGTAPDEDCGPGTPTTACDGNPEPTVWLVTVPATANAGGSADCGDCCESYGGSFELIHAPRTTFSSVGNACFWLASSGGQVPGFDTYSYLEVWCFDHDFGDGTDGVKECAFDALTTYSPAHPLWFLVKTVNEDGTLATWTLSPHGLGIDEATNESRYPYYEAVDLPNPRPDPSAPIVLTKVVPDQTGWPAHWHYVDCGWDDELTIEPGDFLP